MRAWKQSSYTRFTFIRTHAHDHTQNLHSYTCTHICIHKYTHAYTYVQVTTAGGGGTGFLASLTLSTGGSVRNDGIQNELATDRGVIQSATVVAHGSGYTSDPVVDVFHPGTDIQVCCCIYVSVCFLMHS